MSRRDAAEFLGVSLRFLEGNTSIPKHNLAGPGAKRPTWRYKQSELEAWLADRKRASEPRRGA
jgi:hypothetical protein